MINNGMKQLNLNKKLQISVSLLIFCSVKAWGLPWFQSPTNDKFTAKKTALTIKDSINFSGNWHGQCNNQPVIDLSIKHNSDNIILSYGFMEEKYRIGDLKSEATSRHYQSEARSSSVTWTREKNALIFTNTTHFMNEDGHLNVFFSKVAMSLDADNLIINGEYYESSAQLGDVSKESLSCTYHRIDGSLLMQRVT